MNPIDNFLAKLQGVKKSGNGWSARCPAHDDRKASLSVGVGDDGKVLFKCHAGCGYEAVIASLGLSSSELKSSLPKFTHKPKKTKSSVKPSGKVYSSPVDVLMDLEGRFGKSSQLWNYRNLQNENVGFVVRWDKKDGKEIRPAFLSSDGWRIGAMPEPRPLYRLPKLSKAEIIIVTEGEKAANAAESLGFTATTSAGGAQAPAKTDWSPLAGKQVWIFPDNDEAGKTYADTVTKTLSGLNPVPVIRIVSLPDLPAKGDIVDWIDAQPNKDKPEELRTILEQMASAVEPIAIDPSKSNPLKTKIYLGTDEHRVNDEATAALASSDDIYKRGGLLVRILRHSRGKKNTSQIRRVIGEPVIRELSAANLREALTKLILFVEVNGKDEIRRHPPAWCVNAVHSRGDWENVRLLDAVVSHPVLLADGKLLTANGYDAESGLLVNIPDDLELKIPEKPNRDDVAKAVQAIDDVISDFPFETPAHRAAWYASLLTPLAWFSFEGPSPLFLIDANVRGAGKGLLADTVAIILTGRRFAVMSYSNESEELRKRITTLALEGDRLVLLDNLTGLVGNGVLDAALTTNWWKDRILGGNRRYDGPLNVTWYATGNNVQFQGDTSRRVCPIRLESKDERPELRENVRYKNLRSVVQQRRGELLSAALTILKGWYFAGCPKHNLPPWGSFEGWSDVVREAVVFAGLSDPGETREKLQTLADTDSVAMTTILNVIRQLNMDKRGISTAELISLAKDVSEKGDNINDLRVAVEDLCGKLDSRLLGYKFRHFKRRNFGGWFLDSESGRNSNRWVACQIAGGTKDITHVPHHQE